MKTPLGQARGLGSAHHGTRHWWHERLSSIAAIPLTLFLIWYVVAHLGAPRAEIIASMKNPLVAAGFLLSWLNVLWHMKLGMQVIIEDYIHHKGLRLIALVANTFFAIAIATLAVIAIADLMFRA